MQTNHDRITREHGEKTRPEKPGNASDGVDSSPGLSSLYAFVFLASWGGRFGCSSPHLRMPLGAVFVTTLLWVGLTLGLRADQSKTAPDYPHFADFTLIEDAGVSRTSEPVRAEFALQTGVVPPTAALLRNTSQGTRVPVQLEPAGNPHSLRVLFLATQPAGSSVSYRLYYGNAAGQGKPESGLKVSGEDLAWRVENSCLVADFSPSPGAGRSGQLNKIFLKQPGIWLTRERDQSTLHLSPQQRRNGALRSGQPVGSPRKVERQPGSPFIQARTPGPDAENAGTVGPGGLRGVR